MAPIQTRAPPRAGGPTSMALPAPFADMDVGELSPPMRRLLEALLLYKSVFSGPWFASLSSEEDPATRAVYARIMTETRAQADRAAALLGRWDALAEHEQTERVTKEVLKRLLDDMLSLKKSSTEVFLRAGISSPTEEMRHEFLELADIDRRHAEDLRKAIGVHLPAEPASAPGPVRGYAGVHAGPFPPGTLSGKLKKTLEEAREAGNEPARIILSAMTLRHLRDEGALPPKQGEIFGLPVDIDLSWEDEAFAVASRARVSLAEIVTEMEAEPNGVGPR